MNKKTVNILGTEWTIIFAEHYSDFPDLENSDGTTDVYAKVIHVNTDFSRDGVLSTEAPQECVNKIVRHEIIHAFMHESGLRENWKHADEFGHDETTVDWIAIQAPKIFEVFKQLEIM